MSDLLLSADSVFKSYKVGGEELPILKGISLDVKKGESLSILGASGTGKSTFLHILGSLDMPDSGQVVFDGQDLGKLDDDELSEFRNQNMGFVFQFHHLLPEFSALENILMPVRIAKKDLKEHEEWAMELMKKLNIEERAHHLPNQLSGGELQRVAIARALILRPAILFADEPTGNVDSENARYVQNLFFSLQAELKMALIVVTHDLAFAGRFPRILRMKDGRWEGA